MAGFGVKRVKALWFWTYNLPLLSPMFNQLSHPLLIHAGLSMEADYWRCIVPTTWPLAYLTRHGFRSWPDSLHIIFTSHPLHLKSYWPPWHVVQRDQLLYCYPVRIVFFDLPRGVGKRKENLPAALPFFDLSLIHRNGCVSPVSTYQTCFLVYAHNQYLCVIKFVFLTV